METSLDPKGFVTTTKYKVTLPKLHQAQDVVAKDLARFKVLVAGRRFGKTRLGTLVCLAKAMQGKNTWWVAPTYAMAMEGWKTIRQLASEYGMEIKESEKTIYTKSGGFVTVRTADNPDRLRGAGLDYIVLDECAYIKEQTWKEVLRPTLTDRKGGALFISTPAGMNNWFYRIYEEAEGKDEWQRWVFPSQANPLIDVKELEVAKKEIGSYLFSQEYDAQFVEQTGGLIKREWFQFFNSERVKEFDDSGYYETNNYLTSGKIRVNESTLRIISTVDLATSTKQTADYTVITSVAITPNNELIILDIDQQRLEAPDIIPLLEQKVEQYDLQYIGIEKAGYQLAFIQMAKRQGLNIRELKADRDKVSRAYPLVAKMESGDIYFPKNAMWISNVQSELLRFPEAEHDDIVDSLAYAVLETKRRKTLKAW